MTDPKSSLFAFAGSALSLAKSLLPDSRAHGLNSIDRLIHECIEIRGGDLASSERAGAFIRGYSELDAAGKEAAVDIIAALGNDRTLVDRAITDLAGSLSEPERTIAERNLRHRLTAKRMKFLSLIRDRSDGLKFIVDLRAALLHQLAEAPERIHLELDCKELLTSCFHAGSLELRRITWDSPASLLERLAKYEAVHEVRGWADLKNRLDSDRRCFAFFHPSMPNEPLIFVEVALVDTLSNSISALLDAGAPLTHSSAATHAIFYSISNCQRGLDGISFGNALLKRVVQALSEEFRNVKTFATLSPIPRFHKWAEVHAHAKSPNLAHLFEARHWIRDNGLTLVLREPLMELCARYLLEAKRSDGKALDPVCHFHLSNGAKIHRINWLADTSSVRVRESLGMMVNYVYQLGQIDTVAQAYMTTGRLAYSRDVRSLLKSERRASDDGASLRNLDHPSFEVPAL